MVTELQAMTRRHPSADDEPVSAMLTACLGTLDPVAMLTSLAEHLRTTMRSRRVAVILHPGEHQRTMAVVIDVDAPPRSLHETLTEEQWSVALASGRFPEQWTRHLPQPLHSARPVAFLHADDSPAMALLDDDSGELTATLNRNAAWLASAGAVARQARLLAWVPSENPALQHAKLEAMAEFVAGAGHEINNPLATIVGRVQLLQRGETNPQRRRMLAVIGGQAYRIRDMIGDAMLFARPPAPMPEELDPIPLTREVVAAVTAEFPQGPAVKLESLTAERIHADANQVRIVLHELLRNAIAASIDVASEVDVVWDRPEHEDRVRLRVMDHGRELTETEREHLFDPFYSGRQAGRGLGFGLPKCRRILETHGGNITAEQRLQGGLTVTCLWPSAAAKSHSV